MSPTHDVGSWLVARRPGARHPGAPSRAGLPGCGETIEDEPEEAALAMEGPPEVGMAGGAVGELPGVAGEPAVLGGRGTADETALGLGKASEVEDEAVRIHAGVRVPPVDGGAVSLAGDDVAAASTAHRSVWLPSLQSIRGLPRRLLLGSELPLEPKRVQPRSTCDVRRGSHSIVMMGSKTGARTSLG